MKIAVFGTGYVGLVQAAVLAEVGHNVICLDIDDAKIEKLKQGEIPIYEPGLDKIVREHSGRTLHFSTDLAEGVTRADIIFIAVGTPETPDGGADLRAVMSVADSIGKFMPGYRLVVNKSTVPVGTADKVRERIAARLQERNANIPFDVASNPEFLKEGSAVSDCLKPDRIIVGTRSEQAKELFTELYAAFNRNHDKMMFMDERSAELTKYAANCMLATKISFMNEMANLADRLGADIEAVRKGIGSDPRIGYQVIYPGCGYGGSCFPKDVKALIHTAGEVKYESRMLNAVDQTNQRQKERLFDMLDEHYKGQLAGKTIAIWGLAFKPNTDDMREAPSRTLMEALWAAGAKVQAYDPHAGAECLRHYPAQRGLSIVTDKEDALEGADALVICTEWKQFRAPDFDLLAAKLKDRLIVDGRNMYTPSSVARHGLLYRCIGRPVQAPRLA